MNHTTIYFKKHLPVLYTGQQDIHKQYSRLICLSAEVQSVKCYKQTIAIGLNIKCLKLTFCTFSISWSLASDEGDQITHYCKYNKRWKKNIIVIFINNDMYINGNFSLKSVFKV